MKTTIGTLARDLDLPACNVLGEVLERGVTMFRHDGELITAGYVNAWLNKPWLIDPLPELTFELTPEVEAWIEEVEQRVTTITVPVGQGERV